MIKQKQKFQDFLCIFQKYKKKRDRYNVERTGERAKPYPTPTSVSKKGEKKLFHIYCIFLLIKQLEKKEDTLE